MSAIDLLSCYALMPMNTDHLHEVELIERLSYSNPWPRDSFTHEIEENGFSHPRVAVTTGDAREVAGYCISWIVFETLQIQNVAVHPRHRRRGLARLLLLRAIEDCRFNSVIAAQLEVRASNVSAQKLYQTLGFRVVGERKKYYSRPLEDAVLLQKRLR